MMKMLLTGEPIKANFAKQIGLINDHFSKQKLNNEVLNIAKKISSKSNLTIKIGKRAFYKQLEKLKLTSIDGLKIKVRQITDEDIQLRKLPKNTTGVVIMEIANDSPINYLNVYNIIIEADKKKIKTPGELKNVLNIALKKSQKNISIAIYNNQNQKRYIGVQLD